MTYGAAPVDVGHFPLDEWTEFLHYLYLPVRLPEVDADAIRLPQRLSWAYPLVMSAMWDAFDQWPGHFASYVYVTARRGFATPDNPLNRPGWHCDGFGTDDLNYTWSSKWGTRWSCGPFGEISDDHFESMEQFTDQLDDTDATIETMGPRYLWRLTPFVVHTTPLIPAPGGMRSFLKVSISKHRYNLEGNSRNHLFDYDWEMFPRDHARNDPARYMADFYEPEET